MLTRAVKSPSFSSEQQTVRRIQIIRRPSALFFLIVAGVCALAIPAAQAKRSPAKTISVSLSPDHWTTVPLPFQALWVGAHNGKLWACGWNEGVAESADGGKTWQVLHFHKNGQIFFSLTFGKNEILASATGGFILRSQDGGQTWNHWLAPPVPPMHTSLCGKTVIAEAPGVVEFRPAAKLAKWSALSATVRMSRRRRRALLVEAACVDSVHWGWIALGDGLGDGKPVPSRFYATTDAGKHWNISTFPVGWRFTSLVVRHGVYDLYGYKNAKGKSRQGLVLYSSDGVKWHVWPETPREALRHCAGAVCEMGTGVADLRIIPLRFWQLPRNYPKPLASLASVGKVTCTVGSQMACALGTGTNEASLNSGPNGAGNSKAHPGKSLQPHSPKRSSPGPPQVAMALNCTEGKVLLTFVASATGRPGNFVLLYAPCKALAILSLHGRWRFSPGSQEAKPGQHRILATVSVRPANIR